MKDTMSYQKSQDEEALLIIKVLAMVTQHLPKKQYKAIPMNVILLRLSVPIVIARWGLLFTF